MKKYLFSIAFLFLFIPFAGQAASLTLEAPREEYYLGDSFTVDLSLGINDVCVNTVETKITFPKDILSIEAFVVGESLINVWVALPSEEEIFDANDKGELYLAGGIPGGYCGSIPGDPGKSNLVAKILFRIPSFYVGDSLVEKLDIKLVDSKVYINDGIGTEDKLKLTNLNLALNRTSGIEPGEYNTLVKNDKTRPEPFVIELQRNDSMFQGQYFAIFSSIDKQSGIDHYELIETKKENLKKTLTEKLIERFSNQEDTNWEIVSTPHLLTDQSLRSIIKVKAVDRAGNERSVEYIPEKPNMQKTLDYDYLIIGLAVLLLIVTAFFIYRFFRYIFKKFRSKSSIDSQPEEGQGE